jgi:hypothetical protein
MIIFWNQREVFVGNSLQKFNEVRQILVANNIKYKHKLVNNNNTYLFSSRRARTGTYGENMDYSIMYYIYVHMNDYDNACAVLKN